MDLTWQQINALSTLTLNPNVTKVRVAYGWTTKHRGRKSLFGTIWLKGKVGPQMVYMLAARSTQPKRWRKPVTLESVT